MGRRPIIGLGPMSAAERKRRQREREADQANRRESLDTKRDHAQALADQLLTSAGDLAAKLAAERKLTISTRDIARHMIGLDGTDHVRQALEGEPVTLPPPSPTAETVTPSATPTDAENDECALCFEEPKYFFRHSRTDKRFYSARIAVNCCVPRFQRYSRAIIT